MNFIACYSNFELSNPFISLKLIIWSLFIGFVAASLLAVYNKRVIGGFVKKLLSEQCLSPDAAITLTELGYGTDFFIKSALRGDNALNRFVSRVDSAQNNVNTDGTNDGADIADVKPEAIPDDKAPAKKRGSREKKNIDFMTARFYIPEDVKYRAEVRYASRGTDLFSLFLCVFIFAAAAFAALYLIPDLIQLIDNFISEMKTTF